MRRIAITLPEDQIRAIDAICRKRRIPRNSVIRQAIAHFLSEQNLVAAVRGYEEGYLRIPEDPAEVEAYGRMGSEVLEPEDWA